MKHAQLWKRILNEGIGITDYTRIDSPSLGERSRLRIIKAPIIVLTSPLAIESVKPIENNVSIAFPFDCFWLEAHGSNGALLGNLVESFVGGDDEKHEPWWRANTFNAYVAYPNMQARHIASWLLGTSLAGITRNVKTPLFPQTRDSMLAMAIFSETVSALSFMACKNVSLEPHDNDPKQVRRAIKRHGGTPESYRYHTLVVRPAGAGPHVKGEPLGIMPRHVCRGHFAEYGPDFGKGLLFGIHGGRFYIPPHMKGDKKNGIVEKDYEIRN